MHQNTNTGRWSGLPSVRDVWSLLRWPLAILIVETIVSVAAEAPLWTHATFAATIAVGFAVIISRDLWIPPLVARVPTKHQLRLWLRDYWKRCLVIVPLGLAGFLAWHFWPWGLAPAALILFATTVSTISWRRVRKGYGGMEFPHQTVLRAEVHHPLAFLVFGWEWGTKPRWRAPERGEERWVQWALGALCSLLWRFVRNAQLWPVIFALAIATAAYAGGLETFINPWWLGLVWLGGLLIATNYWWRFAIFVWPAYRVVLTEDTVVVVQPVRGAFGTVDITAPEIPLARIAHWQTTRRALGGGDWDPSFIVGRENVILRWLKDPENFKQAAREQLELLQAQQLQARR